MVQTWGVTPRVTVCPASMVIATPPCERGAARAITRFRQPFQFHTPSRELRQRRALEAEKSTQRLGLTEAPLDPCREAGASFWESFGVPVAEEDPPFSVLTFYLGPYWKTKREKELNLFSGSLPSQVQSSNLKERCRARRRKLAAARLADIAGNTKPYQAKAYAQLVSSQ